MAAIRSHFKAIGLWLKGKKDKIKIIVLIINKLSFLSSGFCNPFNPLADEWWGGVGIVFLVGGFVVVSEFIGNDIAVGPKPCGANANYTNL